MLDRRTDLAAEAAQLYEGRDLPPGVEARERMREGFPVTVVKITSPEGAKALGKPEGSYVTLDLTALKRREQDAFGRAVRALAHEIGAFSVVRHAASALVLGLGNRAVTPDAVGPLAVERVLVTRHLVEQLPGQFGSLRPVAAVAAGVPGTTGVESGELAAALCRTLRPDLVIAVDALAARSLSRVCTTIQIADTGIVPGSGVGNARRALNRDTLGVPVLAVGAPTVVDGATLAADLLAGAGQGKAEPDALRGQDGGVFVTPRDIDERTADLARVIGTGLTLALQPDLDLADAEALLG